MRAAIARLSVVVALAAGTHGWSAAPGAAPGHVGAARAQLHMMAKKKAKPRKPTPKAAPMSMPMPSPPSLDASPMGGGAPAPAPAPGSDLPLDQRLDQALRDAGIQPSSGDADEMARGGPADPLSRIPKKGQELLERFFAGGAVTFGVVFLVAGISISAEALFKVLGTPLPTGVDEFLVQYVEPAMTPSILTLFGFSISLGLLKQLQLGSESAGVLYTEDDDE